MVTPLIAVIIIYSFIILWIRWGWKQISPIQPVTIRPTPFISVIIAFKDENKTLPHLIRSLKSQSLSQHKYEIICVNDHSIDDDYQWLIQEGVKLIQASGTGKKAALRQGINAAKGELIITTDADCIVGKQWLETIKETYTNSNAAMILAPVSLLIEETSFFYKF